MGSSRINIKFFFVMSLLFLFILVLTGGTKVVKAQDAVDPSQAVCWIPDKGEYFMSVDEAADAYPSSKVQLLKDASEGKAGDDGAVTIEHYVDLDLNGHTISNKLRENIYTIIVGWDAKLNVTDSKGGGKITNNAWIDSENPTAAAVCSRAGSIKIYGGTIEAENNYALSVEHDWRGFVEIRGGTFIAPAGKTLCNNYKANLVEIYDGRFTDDTGNDVDHYDCMDKKLVLDQESGYYELVLLAARIPETKQSYLTLGEAYTAVQEGQTIQLASGIDNGANTFETKKTFTLDLNAKTIKSSAAQTILATSGSLTIVDDRGWYEDFGAIVNSSSSGSAVRVNGADVTIGGGDLSGAYGVTAAAGTVTIPDNSKATIKGDTSSVTAGENTTFNILGGCFSDKAGNGKNFNLPEGKQLVKIPKGKEHEGWYELGDLNKTALAKSIEDAQSDSDAAAVSATGKDLPDGTVYVSQAVKDALGQAIADAQAVYDDSENQTEVDAAKTTLDTARQTFDDAKQTAAVDKAPLQNAVDEAVAPEDIQVSEDGADVPDGKNWATAEDKQAYEGSLTNARDVLGSSETTQNDADSALQDLLDNAAKIKKANVDRSELADSISIAISDKDITPESADGKDLPGGTEYVSPEDAQKFAAAVNAAQETVAGPEATQNDIDTAKTALDNARQTFDDAKKIAVTDKTALRKAVEEATDPENIRESADGNDVINPVLWATAEDKRIYADAFQLAKGILDDPAARQNDIDEALKALEDSAKNIKTGNLICITYDPNGGVFRNSASPTNELFVIGTEFEVAEAPVRPGFTFLYWKGSEYQPGDRYKATEHHTFTAQWKKDEQTDDSGSKSDSGKSAFGKSGKSASGKSGKSASGKSGDSDGSGSSGRNAASAGDVKTGDESDAGFLMTLMMIAAASAALAFVTGRRS